MREWRDSGFEYIFRDGLYLTPLSHDVAIAVGEIGVSQAAIGAPLCGNNDIGTAPATPHSGTSRRGSTAHVVPSRSAPWRIVPESIPVSFSFVSFASTLSLSLSLTRSFLPLPLLLPYPHLALGMRVSPTLRNHLQARTFSRFHICLPRTIAAASLSFCDRVAHPIPSPCPLDVDVPPPPERPASEHPPRA